MDRGRDKYISIAKEGDLAVTTNNDPRIFRTAPRIKDCVHAVCDSSGDQLKTPRSRRTR